MSKKTQQAAARDDSQWKRPDAISETPAAAGEAPAKKRRPRPDPYDDPTAPQPKPRKKRRDPYDDPSAAGPKTRERRRRVDIDPYDDPLYEEHAAQEAEREAERRRRAEARRRRAEARKAAEAAQDGAAGIQDMPKAQDAADIQDIPEAQDAADIQDVPEAQDAADISAAVVSAAAPEKKDRPVKKSPAGKKDAPKDEADDPYDMLIADAEAAGRSEKKAARRSSSGSRNGGPRRPRKKKKKGGWLTFVLSSLIAVCLMVGVWQIYSHHRFEQMRSAVESGGFFPGTWVDGKDISGMSLEDAVSHWREDIEPGYASRTVTFDDDTAISAADAGYSSDYEEVLTGAWDSQRAGTVEERYKRLKGQESNPYGHGVQRTFYTDEKLGEIADRAAEAVDAPMKDARLTGFRSSDQTFIFEEGVSGASLDKEKLISDMKAAFDNGGGSVTRSITTISPTTTVADIQDDYGMRSSAVTNASSSSSNRLNNIKLALSSIDGCILRPGEEFSFNEVVGQRTTERGYKLAGAYSDGTVIEEVGGGICQVSTTLFNAAVKADLEITERRAHSLPVSYVDKGKDATVSWGSQDLKFKNNTDAPVCIVARLTDEKRVKIGVFGLIMEDGQYITVEAETTEVIDFETTYQDNIFLLPGKTNVLQKGQKGYKAVAYKLTWSKDGELLDRELLCKSTYSKRDEIIEIGPMP